MGLTHARAMCRANTLSGLKGDYRLPANSDKRRTAESSGLHARTLLQRALTSTHNTQMQGRVSSARAITSCPAVPSLHTHPSPLTGPQPCLLSAHVVPLAAIPPLLYLSPSSALSPPPHLPTSVALSSPPHLSLSAPCLTSYTDSAAPPLESPSSFVRMAPLMPTSEWKDATRPGGVGGGRRVGRREGEGRGRGGGDRERSAVDERGSMEE